MSVGQRNTFAVLNFELRRDGSRVVIRLDGNIVAETIPRLARALEQAEAEGLSELHFDFAYAGFMDSRGVGAITGWHRHFTQLNIDFRLMNLQGDCLRVLEISNLISLLNVGPKPREASEILLNQRRALWASHEYGEQVLGALGEGLVALAVDGAILYVNHATEDLLGVKEADFLGKPLHDAIRMQALGGDEVLAAESPFLAAARGDCEPFHAEFLIHREDAPELPVMATATPISRGGKAVGAIVGLLDISDRLRLVEASRVASRLEASAQLASGISHTLRNLMVGIQASAELLRSGQADATAGREALDEITKSAHRTNELAQLLLAFAREGKRQPQPLNLNLLVNRVAASLREMPVSASARIEQSLADGLWSVEADPGHMSQMAMSLAINAVEALQESGTVRLTTRNVEFPAGVSPKPPRGLKPGRYVSFTVKDDGRGMDAEGMKRIFEPFYSTKAKGRGLGLSAAHGIVKSHGGRILVESAPGGGAEFRVFLPATGYRAEEASGVVAEEAPAPARGAETILVADDDDLVRSVSRAILERLGYRVLAATTADEALEMVRNGAGKIDLLILDMVMPGTPSTEAFSHFREARPDMRIILCSGYAPGADFDALMRQGASAFVPKPYTPDELGAEIRRALDKDKSRD